MFNPRAPEIDLRIVAAVASAFFISATLSVLFGRLNAQIALIWIANAPLIAALLARPASERRFHIAACFIAALLTAAVISPYTALAPIFAFAAVFECVIAWLLLRALGVGARVFLSLRHLAAFVVAAGVVGPMVSGVLPAVGMWLNRGSDPWDLWITWTFAHGLGALIVTPILLTLLARPIYRDLVVGPPSVLRHVTLASLLIGLTSVCFTQNKLPLLFVPVLPLILVTLIYRVGGAAIGVFVIAVIGGALTMTGHGPIELIDITPEFRLQFFQFYLATLFLIAMPFATASARSQQLAMQIAQSEKRYRMITDHVSDVVVTFAPGGVIDFVSPSARTVIGHPPENLIGKGPVELVYREDRDRVRAAYRQIVAEPEQDHRFDFRAHGASGALRWFEVTARAVCDERQQVSTIVTVVREFSQHKAREADLLRQASTDPMTGVLNRRAFKEQIDRHRTSDANAPAALALFDLDYFKQVNDRYGHGAGDAALLLFADILRANLRTQDAVGRLGGEEFAVFFPGLSAAAAYHACERVRIATQAVRIHSGQFVFGLTVSAGIAPLVTGQSPDDSFNQADTALYRAKALGRNRSELAQ